MIIVALTGMFKDFLIVMSIILIHEFGHFIMAKRLNWNIDKIAIYPFGGCVKFNEKINKSIKEEILILISGPVVQVIYFFLVYILYKNNLILSRNYLLFKTYNFTLLSFNLLPIYPLDGGRLLNLFLYYIFPYKLSNKITMLISFINIVLSITLIKDTNFLIMISLLLYEILLYYKKQAFLYNKLMLERYLNCFNFKKLKIIKNKNNMYKERRHVFKMNNKFITEKEYLNYRFKGVK